MRQLPKHYLHLYNGLSRIRDLNQRFQLEWKLKISRWNQAADAEYARRWTETEKAREMWDAVRNEVRPQKVIGGSLLVLALFFVCPGLVPALFQRRLFPRDLMPISWDMDSFCCWELGSVSMG
jgi:hypothetical protein